MDVKDYLSFFADDDDNYELKALRDTHNDLQKIQDELHKYLEELVKEHEESERRWNITNLKLILQKLKPQYGNGNIDDIVISFVYETKPKMKSKNLNPE